LTYVATVSFLASRLAPSGGFWVALAGGVAVARTAERCGIRHGYGATFAAMLESTAIMGPARAGVPFTQALSAPVIGRLEARRAPVIAEFLACAAIRLLHNTATTAFFVWVIVGVDAYTGSYDAILGRIPGLPEGRDAALILTGISLLAWAVFASTMQVLVYRRALRRWPEGDPGLELRDDADPDDWENHLPSPAAKASPEGLLRFDPRAVVVAGAAVLALLLASTAWPLLAAAAAWLAVTWAVSHADPEPIKTGAALAGILALTTFVVALIGDAGLDESARRALRVALLVAVATWMRAAAGSVGLREVMRRTLHRLRAMPSMNEASHALERLASERRLLEAGRSLLDAVGPVDRRPIPILDAVLGWVRAEAVRFRPEPPPPALDLSARSYDAVLVVLAFVPAAVLPLA
jgi:hypothetical protein